MTANENIEQELEQLARAIESHDSIVPAVMNRIQDIPHIGESQKRTPMIRRIIMNRFTKFAAAAVIVIGVILGISVVDMTASYALAETIRANSGVVMEDIAEGVLGLTGATDVMVGECGCMSCLSCDDPGYAFWAANGMPDCWCYRKQCRGDADGVSTGPFAVGIPDLTNFQNSFNVMNINSAPLICSDFDHLPTGPFRVGIPDLTTFQTYFNVMGVTDCPATHINYWKN